MSAEEIPVVTPIETATEAMERIEWHKQVLDQHDKLAGERRKQITDKIAWHENTLRTAAVLLSREYGKAVIELPNGGSTRSAKAKGNFNVTNDDDAMKFAKKAMITTKTLKVSYTGKALRNSLKETDSGLVDPSTGELVTFAEVKYPESGLSFSYKLPDKVRAEAVAAEANRGPE